MRTIWLCALSLLAGIAAATLFSSDADADAKTKPADQLTVMSFNVRYGSANDGDDVWDNRKEFLVETIQEVSPDLLGTQECLNFQRDFIAKHLPGYEVHAASREDGKEKGEMCAIFFRTDRFEKLDGGHFWLSETPEVPGSKSWDSSLPRMASWVKLKDKKSKSDRPILYVNTHFDHRGEQARIESAKQIRNWAAQFADCDLVLTGDFNAGEDSAPYKAMFAQAEGKDSVFGDSYRIATPKRSAEEGTFNGFKPSATSGDRIDWIGVSENFNVMKASILRNNRDGHTPSDHFPISAQLNRSK
ncbi:endonuclease/exonuclease/phosphatase family protein [Bremerella sp. JC817]|uniref:endonuclease/exonuclease/phosphatase family protein n=1 Tax=Bremerella sp. JC817 TaxID=3231756 RepID=UPI00345B37E5